MSNHVFGLFVGTKNIVPFNHTLLHLILMKNKPKRPADLCPIAMCNVSYKLLTKLISLRLKAIFPRIIPDMHGDFVMS